MITPKMYLIALAIAFISILLNIGYTLYFLIRNNPKFKQCIESWLFEEEEEEDEEEEDED